MSSPGGVSQLYLSPSQVHFNRTNITISYLGGGDNGQAYTAIPKYAADKLIATHGRQSQALYDNIRNQLIAVKFHKADNYEGDLKHEIDFLSKKLTVQHPLYTPCLAAHYDDYGHVQWIALPYLNGGTLHSFAKKHAPLLGVSFLWHVGLQMAEAVSLLHCGITDCAKGIRDPSLRSVYHADIWSQNVLVRPVGESSSCSYGNFPDLVLADFGRADDMPEDACEKEKAGFERTQVADIVAIGEMLTDLIELLETERGVGLQDCEFCTAWPMRGCESRQRGIRCMGSSMERLVWWATCMGRFGELGYDLYLNQGHDALRDFISLARIERAAQYQPLPAQVVSELVKVKVGNELIEAALQEAGR
ncbi:hypothetical protein KC365_g4366 [Hortaea werneckii]|nr:hypothetical protein KC342_g7435 [Hortaea werneckii]KAI7097602.1 hypothetical protein KC339_g9580 [Hortaea werneckii]KAI7238550.1 hypothetical protein KC365_g4366 [Hortaea werneckii]